MDVPRRELVPVRGVSNMVKQWARLPAQIVFATSDTGLVSIHYFSTTSATLARRAVLAYNYANARMCNCLHQRLLRYRGAPTCAAERTTTEENHALERLPALL